MTTTYQDRIRGFGERIRARRLARGMTLGQLAEAVGVSRQAVHQWETGRCLPSCPRAVAEALDLPLDELVL